MNTGGLLQQRSSFTDGIIFVPTTEAVTSAGAYPVNNIATLNTYAAFPNYALAASSSITLLFPLSNLLQRSGMLANKFFQQQFGTAASVAGPSSVANTSDAYGFGANANVPPILKTNLPTTAGPVAGAVAKGIQINSVDAIYSVTSGLTAATIQMVRNKVPAGTNQAVTSFNDIPATTTGALTATSANSVHRARVANPNPIMLTDNLDLVTVLLTLTSGAGQAANIFGIALNCNFNFN